MKELKILANALADASGEIIQKYYRQPFDIENKTDASPVTIADRAVEKKLREMIEAARPDDGIYGEEFGIKDSKSGYIWVLDPIDGTKPFICGRPTFGTLIALCDESGTPILGVIDQPILKDRWVGVKGEQTTHNGSPVTTRKCANLKNAVTGSTSPGMFGAMPQEFILNWREQVNFTTWGNDCIGYGLMASGYMDIMIEADMQPYDYLAHVPIVEGAGGKVCDFDGKPLTLHSGDTVVALGNPDLWDEVKTKIIDY